MLVTTHLTFAINDLRQYPCELCLTTIQIDMFVLFESDKQRDMSLGRKTIFHNTFTPSLPTILKDSKTSQQFRCIFNAATVIEEMYQIYHTSVLEIVKS